MHHYRKTLKIYRDRKHKAGCPFCDEKTLSNSIRDTTYSYVVPNLTHYDLWEMRTVIDHLLIVPKRHVLSLTELDPEERLDIMDLMAEYEANGYNVYARSQDSVSRSVPHQHTHLIKTADKKAKASLFLNKPYVLFKF